jgi:DNA-binding transcriptional regulator YdaS (Cro superfamily)
MSTFSEIVKRLGGVSAVANLLDERPQTVSNWRTRGVPAERAIQLEAKTNGIARCEEMRPDIDWSVLRAPRIDSDAA